MEGSYPKCDASTNYQWTKLGYSEIGNTCNASVAPIVPTCIDLQYEYQCTQAMNGKYKQLIYANGNTVGISSISDCTSTSFRYNMSIDPTTSYPGNIGEKWRACSSAPASTTPTPTNTGATPSTPVACTGNGNSFNFSNSTQTNQCVGVMPTGNR